MPNEQAQMSALLFNDINYVLSTPGAGVCRAEEVPQTQEAAGPSPAGDGHFHIETLKICELGSKKLRT